MSLFLRGLLLGLLLLPASGTLAAGPRPASLRASVVGVSDGDTLTVLTAQRRKLKVRLWGIDAPEKKQAFGQRSKRGLSELVFGREVLVEVKGRDRYGRTLGWVLVEGRPANLLMVERGLAWWYRQYSARALEIGRAEQEARSRRLGLWADPQPQAPWEWRRSRRRAAA